MPPIHPCLWFDSNAEDAAKYYCSIFPNSKITSVSYYGENQMRPAGTVLLVSFELDGRKITALNGGPHFKLTSAFSLVVTVEDQAELDRVNEALIAGGGHQEPCAWVVDKFGLSWQIVPKVLEELITSKVPGRSQRVMDAVLQMQKLDIATLERAAGL